MKAEMDSLLEQREATLQTSRPFEYQRLNENDIRFLHVHPQKSTTGMLHCSLAHLDMSVTPLERLSFYALSYTWGDACESRTIIVNDRAFRVRKPLAILNVYTQKFPNKKPLWIDQICVDQQNIAERNHQVKLMAKIYSKAAVVLAWIGDNSHDSNRALDALQKLQSVTYMQRHLSGMVTTAINALFNRSYWSRLWIVQEVLLASSVLVMCGDLWVSWKSIMLLHEYIYMGSAYTIQPNIPIEFPEHLQSLILLYNERKWNPMQPIFWKMIDILDHFAPCSCRDPRDKVFGLMVFVSESEAMKIDYMLTAEELFTLVVEKVSDYAPEVVISFARRLRISMGLELLGASETTKVYGNTNLTANFPVQRGSEMELPANRGAIPKFGLSTRLGVAASTTRSVKPHYQAALAEMNAHREKLHVFKLAHQALLEDRERQQELSIIPRLSDALFEDTQNRVRASLNKALSRKSTEVESWWTFCRNIGLDMSFANQSDLELFSSSDLLGSCTPPFIVETPKLISPFFPIVNRQVRVREWLEGVYGPEMASTTAMTVSYHEGALSRILGTVSREINATDNEDLRSISAEAFSTFGKIPGSIETAIRAESASYTFSGSCDARGQAYERFSGERPQRRYSDPGKLVSKQTLGYLFGIELDPPKSVR